MKKEIKKMVKVVYFDENTAIDYINIEDGGFSNTNKSELKKDKAGVDIKGNAGIEGKFSLFKWFSANASIQTNSELLKYGENVMKSTLTNTILTDYLEKTKIDKNVKKFDSYVLCPIENSLAYYKMYTPYTILFKDDFSDKLSPGIDIKKLDEVISSVKGYYEFEAVDKKDNNIKYIFRFNINGFRNNYKLSNMMNMNLSYYGIKVGYGTLEQYNVEHEFDFNSKAKEITIEEMKNGILEQDKTILEIYDIVLAGVENE